MNTFSTKDLEQIEDSVDDYINIAQNLGTTAHAVASWFEGGDLWSATVEEINEVDKIVKNKIGEQLYKELEVSARLGGYVMNTFSK